MKLKKMAVYTAIFALSITGLSGCGGSNTGSSTTGQEMEFWGWAPGYKEAVELWNKTHPDMKVKFKETASTDKAYPKMFTAIKAGNAPCLAQVEYGALPNFVIQDAVEPITKQGKDLKKDFTEDGWVQSNVAGELYGIPVDTAPIAFIYNKAAFDKFGITAPKTWEEYREMAKKVKEQDSTVSIGYFANDPNWNAALARQKGAKWFEMGKDAWKVSIDDQDTKEVADFWQSMIDEGLIKAEQSYQPALYKQMAEGKILSEPFGIWDTKVLAQNLKGESGKWAVAPMPVWKDRPGVYVSAGGSATVVLKGCQNVDNAVKFAHWMATDNKSVNALITDGGLWPASIAGLSSPALDKPVEFYGNAKIYEPFKEISKSIKPDWTWGPLQNQLNGYFWDAMAKVNKEHTIYSVYQELQKKTIADIEKAKLKVEK